MPRNLRDHAAPPPDGPAPVPASGRDAPVAFSLQSLQPLDHASAMPLYMQLAERLAAPIRAGHGGLVGHALPTEMDCMAYFGVSRPTVRQAMGQLVSTGLVARGRGRGTFVAPERLNHDVSLAFEDEMRTASRTVRFQLLERRRVPAPAAVARMLGLESGQEVDHVERLRFLDGEVFAFEERFLPQAVADHVTREMLEGIAIISLLTEAMGQSPARITNTVRCIPTQPRIARLLGVRPSTPLLQTEHTYYATSGSPLLHGTVWFHGERFEFTLESPIQAGRRG